jgi:hypothetical protein
MSPEIDPARIELPTVQPLWGYDYHHCQASGLGHLTIDEDDELLEAVCQSLLDQGRPPHPDGDPELAFAIAASLADRV